VTRCDGVTTSVGGEATPGREKRVDDASWTAANLTRQKKKKINAADLAAINRR
jgi:hypothetical protein